MIHFQLSNGTTVELSMPKAQGTRLKGTCFRGTHVKKGGNFGIWDDFAEFLSDPEVRSKLTAEFEKMVERPTDEQLRLELQFSRKVGWDSVMLKEDLKPGDLEQCFTKQLSKRATALFLPTGYIDAPATEFVTMVMYMKFVDGHWVFVISTMYPGADCGQLEGNMTEKEDLIWLDWENPGEPLDLPEI